MLDLNDLIPRDSPWVLQFAAGINDSGQIAGQGLITSYWLGIFSTFWQRDLLRCGNNHIPDAALWRICASFGNE